MENVRRECYRSVYSSSHAYDQGNVEGDRRESNLHEGFIQASVRAMDATQQFAEKLGIAVPKHFVVAGASKVNWFALSYRFAALLMFEFLV